MVRESVTTSRALAQLLRSRRQELGLSLADVTERTGRMGQPIPPSTLGHIEKGTSDPGVLRLVQLLRLYDIPIDSALDLVEARDLQRVPTTKASLQEIYQRGTELWRAGEVAAALAHMRAIQLEAGNDPNLRLLRQKAILAQSIIAKNMGRHALALQLVNGLLCEPVDPIYRIETYIQTAAIWEHLGVPDVSLAFLDRLSGNGSEPTTQQGAWIAHQRSRLNWLLGHTDAASEQMELAIRLYRECSDFYGEARAHYTRMECAMPPMADLPSRIAAARSLIRFTEEHGIAEMGANTAIRLGEYLFKSGEHEHAERAIRTALGWAVPNKAYELEFLCHFYLWKMYAQTGESDRAALERDAAIYFSRFAETNHPERAEIEALKNGGSDAPTTRRNRRRR